MASAMPGSTRRQFCDTALGQVHVLTAGPPGAPPLLLLHQIMRSSDEWHELLPLLAPHLRIIAVDLPGYGCSDKPPPGVTVTVEAYARAVVAVLDALGVAAAAVAGLHLGGVVAAEVAAAFPARVSKVILLGPILFDAAGRAERTPFFERHMQQPKLWTLAPDGSHLTAIWARFARYTSSVPLLHRLVLDMLRAGPLTQDEFPVLLYRQEDRLPLLSCPALLVYWRDDIFATPARAAPLREAFRPGSEVVLEGGAYGVHEDAPALARAILAYLM